MNRDSQFRMALEAAPSGMILCDERGNIVLVNAAAERIFGYDRADLIGRPIEILVPDQMRKGHARSRTAYAEHPEPRQMARRPVLLGRNSNGVAVPVEIGLNPIDGAEGTYVLCSVVDLTQQHDLERQVRVAQRMEAVGRLAGGVAHDFNNLLTVIQSYATFLIEQFRREDPAYEDVQAIREAANRAEALTRQLLAFSRRQVLEPRVLSVEAAIREIEPMLRRLLGEDVTVVTRLESGDALISADPAQLDQILVNLAVNARDAMPDGGTLTIRTGATQDRGVSLEVSDTGIGMDEETQQQIFEPFFTTKEKGKGTGLGLSTVYGIVMQSGGEIEVHSEPGSGTTFSIVLPRVEGEVEPPTRGTGAFVDERGSETILLVEDDRMVRKATTRMLERSGYRVLAAASGDEAIQIASSRTEPIDLLLTDVILPGVSGSALSEHVLARHPEIGVIFMSGYTDDEVVRQGVLEHGVTFLQKPFEASQLLRTVREKLGTPTPQPSR